CAALQQSNFPSRFPCFHLFCLLFELSVALLGEPRLSDSYFPGRGDLDRHRRQLRALARPVEAPAVLEAEEGRVVRAHQDLAVEGQELLWLVVERNGEMGAEVQIAPHRLAAPQEQHAEG